MEMETDQQNNNTNMNRTTALQRKSCYRNLIAQVETINESGDVGLQTAKELHAVLEKVNQLEDEYHITQRVKQFDETLIDSFVLSSASSLLVKCIESVDSINTNYEAREFCNKLIATIQPEGGTVQPKHWLSLLKEARSIINEVPQYDYTYGGLNFDNLPQPKERKEKVKQAQERVEKKQLQSVTNAEKEEEGIDEIVNDLRDVLNDEYEKNDSKPILYNKYVLNTDSYGETVENIFYCSFLIRNGQARMDFDHEGNATIRPVTKRELEAFTAKKGQNTQRIVSFDMDEWMQLKEDIEEGFLQRHKKKRKKST